MDKLHVKELVGVEMLFTEGDVLCQIEVYDLLNQGRAGCNLAKEGVFLCNGPRLLKELALCRLEGVLVCVVKLACRDLQHNSVVSVSILSFHNNASV